MALFVTVLEAPLVPSTEPDLILLDVVAGFASRLKFATCGDLRFPSVRELAQLARKFIDLEPLADPPRVFAWSGSTARPGEENEIDVDCALPGIPRTMGTS